MSWRSGLFCCFLYGGQDSTTKSALVTSRVSLSRWSYKPTNDINCNKKRSQFILNNWNFVHVTSALCETGSKGVVESLYNDHQDRFVIVLSVLQPSADRRTRRHCWSVVEMSPKIIGDRLHVTQFSGNRTTDLRNGLVIGSILNREHLWPEALKAMTHVVALMNTRQTTK